MATTPAENPTPRLDATLLRTTGALLATQTAVSRLIDAEAVEPTGQDPTTIDLLVRLDLSPGSRLRAVQLSRELLLSPSHVSRMIDRAEVSGLVERCEDPSDRRASQVVMTDAGRAVLEDFAPRLEQLINRIITERLSPEESDVLVGLLQRIEAATHET